MPPDLPLQHTHYLKRPLSWTYFHGSKSVRAIEIILYPIGLAFNTGNLL